MEGIFSWSKRAKCVNEGVLQEHLTKKYCTGCPVKGLCNTYAIVHGERGIWGGTNEKERSATDPLFIELLRQQYQEAGLLEKRFVPLEFSAPQEEQLQEQQDPNVQTELYSGSTSDQSLLEQSDNTLRSTA